METKKRKHQKLYVKFIYVDDDTFGVEQHDVVEEFKHSIDAVFAAVKGNAITVRAGNDAYAALFQSHSCKFKI